MCEYNLAMEYYNIICDTRDKISIINDKINYKKCKNIINEIYNEYCNDSTIEELTLLLYIQLYKKFKYYIKLNIAIITRIKILYKLLFPTFIKNYKKIIIDKFNHENKYTRAFINDMEIINDCIFDIIYYTICETIIQLDIINMEEFKNIFNDIENNSLYQLKLQYNEVLIELNKKEKKISVLESEIFPFGLI